VSRKPDAAARASKRILLVLVALAACGATPAVAQSIVCCNQAIAIGGPWIGSSRIGDCQQYFDNAPTDILRRMCQQRAALACINTSRCATLPPEPPGSQQSKDDGVVQPPDVDRDGLEQGFYGPPPADPAKPPAPPSMPHRLVYIAPWGGQGDKPSKGFTAWLDRAACPLPLDRNNRLADSTAAKHVVRGKVVRRDGRVHIEAEAQERPGGARIGPFTGETDGDDAAAIAKALRAVAEQMKLVCAR
jgi:hypothetical protein